MFNIEVPPLRERKDDVPLLTRFCIEKYARAMGRPAKPCSAEAMAILEQYRWPGNVRELENAIERAMVIGKEAMIVPADLPLQVEEKVVPVETSLAAMEKDHIERVLQEMGGNMTRSARVLGIDRATLYNKVKRYGIRR
ncbi:MAG TPA: helix-turn-helix domain-containing protein [Gemmatimonadales bacterium]